jgi:hypothetical protein
VIYFYNLQVLFFLIVSMIPAMVDPVVPTNPSDAQLKQIVQHIAKYLVAEQGHNPY